MMNPLARQLDLRKIRSRSPSPSVVDSPGGEGIRVAGSQPSKTAGQCLSPSRTGFVLKMISVILELVYAPRDRIGWSAVSRG